MDNQRNIITAVLLTALILFGWDAAMRYFYPQPDKPAASAPATVAGNAPASTATPKVTLQQALGGSRVLIETPRVKGSINLAGAQLDDITLLDHRQTIDKKSAPVRLFSPAGTSNQHFAQFGWVGKGVATPTSATLWTADGTKLTSATPVTLSWDNGVGQTYRIRYAIDADFMITATQSVVNSGAAPVAVEPYQTVTRSSQNASVDSFNVHSGPIGLFDDAVNFKTDYDTVDDAEDRIVKPEGRAGWIGFTDIYWMSVLIPDAKADNNAAFRRTGAQTYRADLIGESQIVGPGQTLSGSTRLFAGAKENDVLDAYEAAGISNFSLSIDWGWFRWFEKPIFYLLDWLFKLTTNFGVAIILLTVIIRGIMFPIAQKQFASMAAMKAIQPKMKAIQDRYKDDKPKQQQEIMELYKKEKVNPLAGCLPILIQIPIFFALYKVLILTIEMRHQPFALWINDLSAPDPMFFGLTPDLQASLPTFLAIGILPMLLGITMWLQFKLQPTQPDPIQQQVFAIMPWMMVFLMAPFAAGLQLYWTVSNILTIAQQKWLYSKHPQLKAQAEKDAEDKARADARDKPQLAKK